MYQASHLQSCQVPAHMNRQLVGGRQAGSSSSSSTTRNGPSYLGSIFFLPRSLSYTHTFYPSLCSSSFLVLSPPLWSTPVMLNHPHTHSYYTHTWSSTPSLSLSFFSTLLQWQYARVQMATMEASSMPLSDPRPCRFYSSFDTAAPVKHGHS